MFEDYGDEEEEEEEDVEDETKLSICWFVCLLYVWFRHHRIGSESFGYPKLY